MITANILFPHQLFRQVDTLDREGEVFIVEEFLFFSQYSFHKQKLAFHRASMCFYADFLRENGFSVQYIDTDDERSDVRNLVKSLKGLVDMVHFIDPTDDWLESRIQHCLQETGIKGVMHPSQLFLNSREDLNSFFNPDRSGFFQTEFYIEQRKRRKILLDGKERPEGGKWSYDAENRKKYPAGKNPPAVGFPKVNDYWREACAYVSSHFPENPGKLDGFFYPVDFNGAEEWFLDFLNLRLKDFGPYEDAIVEGQMLLHHSLLTPLLNTGLLTPGWIISQTLKKYEEEDLPINSVEGFIRQIMGWREFIRGVYEAVGRKERTMNFWNFKRKMPGSFYSGSTGIIPFDSTIKKVLETGYCHHIERLMILGNFMLLCEIDPDEVYRWFMELFIDSYDWVMVPNVYGMSQFADGGIMATKPYISGSNYIRKMSDYPKGEWQDIWDALFWRFMHVHRDFFSQNPRLGMLVRNFDKMEQSKRDKLLNRADKYLNELDE